jgi:hypothetical protein
MGIMLATPFLIIVAFNFYVAVAQDMPFARRAGEWSSSAFLSR